jgi:hypothetical protein
MGDDGGNGICFFLGLVAGAVIGGVIMGSMTSAGWRAETVNRGFAVYDSKTGEWQWKEAP